MKRHYLKKIKKDVKSGTIRKILIIRNDAIGDAVISLPLIKYLSKKYEVHLLASEINYFVCENEKNIKVIKYAGKKEFNSPSSFGSALLKNTIFRFFMFFGREKKKVRCDFDLVVDFVGYPFIMDRLNLGYKYIIGPNRGIASIYYHWFLESSFIMGKMNILRQYIKLLREVGIKIDEVEVENEIGKEVKIPRNGIVGILVSCKKERQIKAKTWEQIIKICSSEFKKVIIIDDPSRSMIKQLNISEKNVEIMPPMSLKELRDVVRNCEYFIALDGGGQHYLGQGMNELVIYTTGMQEIWKPFTTNKWRKEKVSNCWVEWVDTKNGLRKVIVYRNVDCKPCYYPCNNKEKECLNIPPHAMERAIKILKRNAS
jgi:ADP-heptose:LPS heptosyltransferase